MTDVVAGYATLVARVTELLPPVEVEWVREADQTADLVRQMSLGRYRDEQIRIEWRCRMRGVIITCGSETEEIFFFSEMWGL